MEVQEQEGGVIAIKCTDGQDRGWLNTMPPLGTVNEDNKLTKETAPVLCNAGTYMTTQAVRGRFERFVGDVGWSDTEDQMSSDNNSVTTGPDKVKGYENITMQLEMVRENNKARFEGASKGAWDYTAHSYRRQPSFREYTLIDAFGPDVQSLDMASAEELKIYYGVKIERKEMEYGNPNKFRLPLFARKCITIPHWVELTPVEILKDKVVLASTNYFDPTPPSPDLNLQSPESYQQRLKCTFTDVGTAGPLNILGTNIFGEEVEEEVTLTGTGTIEYITKNYFSVISTNGVQLGAGWLKDVTELVLNIEEYDCKILP